MSPLAEFLDTLLSGGRAVLKGPPSAADGAEEAVEILRRVYAVHRRRVAGPALDFDAPFALAAATVVQHASWFLVSRADPDAELERWLVLQAPGGRPAAHLSADLVLRFLPTIHRRARAQDPADRLTVLLADLLRSWPLSGVLGDVADAPLIPLDFGGHPGLLWLYAERLAQHEKPAWVPDGPGREVVEQVYRDLGRTAAPVLQATAAEARNDD